MEERGAVKILHITLQQDLHRCSSSIAEVMHPQIQQPQIAQYPCSGKNPHKTGPVQFKTMLFKGQLHTVCLQIHKFNHRRSYTTFTILNWLKPWMQNPGHRANYGAWESMDVDTHGRSCNQPPKDTDGWLNRLTQERGLMSGHVLQFGAQKV